MYIAIYNALIMYLDDIIKDDYEIMKGFGRNVIWGQECGHGILDAFAEVVREASDYYGEYLGGVILAATLRYCNALLMEEEVYISNVSLLPMMSKL